MTYTFFCFSFFCLDLLPIKQCHGVILVGASGTGKNAIVRAIKNEFGLPLFKLNDALSDRFVYSVAH